jgi:hypothetical protein
VNEILPVNKPVLGLFLSVSLLFNILLHNEIQERFETFFYTTRFRFPQHVYYESLACIDWLHNMVVSGDAITQHIAQSLNMAPRHTTLLSKSKYCAIILSIYRLLQSCSRLTANLAIGRINAGRFSA